MITSPPKSLVGFGFDPKQGIFVKICPSCKDSPLAQSEVRRHGLRAIPYPCGPCTFQQLEKQVSK